ncbi:hypothetical protein J416_12457 [Gracilibacillus halophilus YIM-C55.5]|uniref:Lipoprotein n=1 Tax=Gracilibacillus halophilus YIM-C55.5 TaxID=1308866 RepID=N4WSJ7_9BACI|nr:hypothetical protein [Gracilibacillus halophilus]ENH96131.1 hypothetical protein J416_12457 [Gracilibacillus halophilus YIM-C55.5]
MRKYICGIVVSIITLLLIGCYPPENKAKNLTRDYYQALINESYEKAFNSLHLYNPEEFDDKVTLSDKEAEKFYMKKISVLEENNYHVKDFEITYMQQEDGHTFYPNVKIEVEVNSKTYEYEEKISITSNDKVRVVESNDPFIKYRNGVMGFDIQEDIKDHK